MGRPLALPLAFMSIFLPAFALQDDPPKDPPKGGFKISSEVNQVKVEQAIGELIPRKEWTMLSHRVIFHGRRVCHSRKPACGACPVARLCPSYGLGPTDAAEASRLVKGPAAQ